MSFELLAKPKAGRTIAMAKYQIDDEEEFVATSFSYKSKTSYRFEESKAYKIKLIVTDSEGDSASYERTVNLTRPEHPPVLDATIHQVAPRKLFIDFHRSFGVHSKIQSTRVVWGDGSVTNLEQYFASHTYEQAGRYELRLRLTDQEGRVAGRAFLVDVTDEAGITSIGAIADFEVEELSFASAFRFYLDRSGSPHGEIVEANWNFGDGTTGSGTEVVHFYEPGIYDVTLSIVDSAGNTDQQTQQVILHGGSPFVANLDCSTQFLNASCKFIALDAQKGLNAISIDWGDSSISEINPKNPEYERIQNLEHTYAASGDYIVKINVQSTSGTLEIERIVSVEIPPSEIPIASGFCYPIEGRRIACDSDSQNNNQGGLITGYRWDMGDGTIYHTQSVDHTYANEAVYNYTIELTVTNLIGFSDSTTFPVNFPAPYPPVAVIYCDDRLVDEISCNAFASYGQHPISTYQWQVNGVVYNTPELILYNQPSGQQLVTLRVIDSFGLEDSTSQTVQVETYPNPNAVIECQQNLGNKIQCLGFLSSSLVPGGFITNYNWTIEGQSFQGPNLDYQVTEARSYLVKLEVTDNYFKTAQTSTTVNVIANRPPVATATCTSSLPLNLFCRIDSASDPDGDEMTYSWKLGDKEFEGELFEADLSSVNASLELIVKDSFENTFSLNITPQIMPGEIEAFFICEQIGTSQVYCQSDSTGTNDSIISYDWIVDGEAFSTEYFITLDLELDQQAQVQLIVKNRDDQQSEYSNQVVSVAYEEPLVPTEGELIHLNLAEGQLFAPLNSIQRFFFQSETQLDEETLEITLNGEILSTDNWSILGQEISVNSLFEEGINDIEINAFDIEGRYIYEIFSIAAGSKTLTINLNDQRTTLTNEDFIIDFAIAGVRQAQYQTPVLDNTLLIENVPAVNMGLILRPLDLTSQSSLDVATIKPDQAIVDLSYRDNLEAIDDIGFENGTNGWAVFEGQKQLSQGQRVLAPLQSTAPQTENVLSAGLSVEGRAHIGALLRLESEKDSAFWELEFLPKSSQDFLLMVNRNRTLGTLSYNVYDMPVNSHLNPIKIKNISEIQIGAENLIDVRFAAHSEPVSFVQSQTGFSLISKVIAQQIDVREIFKSFQGVTENSFNFLNSATLSSYSGTYADFKPLLNGISLGSFQRSPILFKKEMLRNNGNYELSLEAAIINKLRVLDLSDPKGYSEVASAAANRLELIFGAESDAKTDLIANIQNGIEYILLITYGPDETQLSNHKFYYSVNENKILVDIPEGILPPEGINEVKLLIGTQSGNFFPMYTNRVINRKVKSNILSNDELQQLPVLVLAEDWLEADFDTDKNEYRVIYGEGESEDYLPHRAGDKYILREHLNTLNDLRGASFTHTIKWNAETTKLVKLSNPNSVSKSIRLNDTSPINGGVLDFRLSNVDRGQTIATPRGRNESNHLVGSAFDIRYTKKREYGEMIKNLAHLLTANETLEAAIATQYLTPRIQNILATSSDRDNPDNKTSNFHETAKYACVKDYFEKVVISDIVKHKDHFHLNLLSDDSEIVQSRIFRRGKGKTIYRKEIFDQIGTVIALNLDCLSGAESCSSSLRKTYSVRSFQDLNNFRTLDSNFNVRFLIGKEMPIGRRDTGINITDFEGLPTEFIYVDKYTSDRHIEIEDDQIILRHDTTDIVSFFRGASPISARLFITKNDDNDFCYYNDIEMAPPHIAFHGAITLPGLDIRNGDLLGLYEGLAYDGGDIAQTNRLVLSPSAGDNKTLDEFLLKNIDQLFINSHPIEFTRDGSNINVDLSFDNVGIHEIRNLYATAKLPDQATRLLFSVSFAHEGPIEPGFVGRQRTEQYRLFKSEERDYNVYFGTFRNPSSTLMYNWNIEINGSSIQGEYVPWSDHLSHYLFIFRGRIGDQVQLNVDGKRISSRPDGSEQRVTPFDQDSFRFTLPYQSSIGYLFREDVLRNRIYHIPNIGYSENTLCSGVCFYLQN